jgi:hypothetical protein
MLFSRAIRSGDEKTIDDLISKTDSEDIEKCTRDLRIEHVLPFFVIPFLHISQKMAKKILAKKCFRTKLN